MKNSSSYMLKLAAFSVIEEISFHIKLYRSVSEQLQTGPNMAAPPRGSLKLSSSLQSLPRTLDLALGFCLFV